jgi:hypothetical protein
VPLVDPDIAQVIQGPIICLSNIYASDMMLKVAVIEWKSGKHIVSKPLCQLNELFSPQANFYG